MYRNIYKTQGDQRYIEKVVFLGLNIRKEVTTVILIQAIPDQLNPKIVPGKKGKIALIYDIIVVKNKALKNRIKFFSFKLNLQSKKLIKTPILN